jgi:hypothetical protein
VAVLRKICGSLCDKRTGEDCMMRSFMICIPHETARGECMEWIDVAQDRDRWRVLVNAVMNLRVP